MTTQHLGTAIVAAVCCLAIRPVLAQEKPVSVFKVGDAIPEAKCLSVEGMTASSRPPEGKFLLVVAHEPGAADATDRVKAAILLYRRFHAKGLNGLGICSAKSEDQVVRFANRWQIPWPEILNRPTTTVPDGHPPFPLLAAKAPETILIDSQGKVVAVRLEGDQAHATVAEILKVSLADLPMPKPPEPREETGRREMGDIFFVEPEAHSRSMLGTAEERKEAEPCRKNLRRISIALTDYRADHKGELPEHLSDLYPKYLQDETVLLCPTKPETLTDFTDYADPKMKCSYLYEFSPAVRAAKTKQLEEFGDKVAMVRCKSHGRWLSLSYGGEIYFTTQIMWENEFPRGKDLDSDEAKVRERFRTLASALARYRKDKGEVPDELERLCPDYVKDKDLLTCPVTKQAFSYQFSTRMEFKGETYRSFKMKQLKNPAIGEYVPIIRAKGVLSNDRVINLSYGGEIYESGVGWEALFN